MSAKIDVEVMVRFDYGEQGNSITLSKDEAIALRDALIEAFPTRVPTAKYPPGIRTVPVFGDSLCQGMGAPIETHPGCGNQRVRSGVLNLPTEVKFESSLDEDEILDALKKAMAEPIDPDGPNTSCCQPARPTVHHTACKCDGRGVVPGPAGKAVKCDGMVPREDGMDAPYR